MIVLDADNAVEAIAEKSLILIDLRSERKMKKDRGVGGGAAAGVPPALTTTSLPHQPSTNTEAEAEERNAPNIST